ncbi:MAG: DUF1643 domain-containing protein [Bacteroidales bacterium]|nr:DUF1643 domain-containing protein [Bacteroidales bacterium]
MARLGRQVDHFQEIEKKSIRADFSPDLRYRYTLSMSYRQNLIPANRDKCVTVILKNPSSADEKRSDATIRKVETFVWMRFRNSNKLQILNLFAYRATDASELSKWMNEEGTQAGIGPENDSWFIKYLQSTDYLICAWGGPSGIQPEHYRSRIMSVKKLIATHYSGPVNQIVGATTTREPLHGLMWGYNYHLKPYRL